MPRDFDSWSCLASLFGRTASTLFAKDRLMDGLQKLSIEIQQVVVDGFVQASAQEHRQPHFASLKLSFIEQLCSQ